MKHEKILEAVQIALTQGSKATFSITVPVTDNYSNTHSLIIHDCCASLVSKLISADFSLSMSDKGMHVAYYK